MNLIDIIIELNTNKDIKFPGKIWWNLCEKNDDVKLWYQTDLEEPFIFIGNFKNTNDNIKTI